MYNNNFIIVVFEEIDIFFLEFVNKKKIDFINVCIVEFNLVCL